MKLRHLILAGALPLLFACANAKDPEPYGAIPTPLQTEWQKMEYYMFIHFGPNTFTDMEWGRGNENPEVFNPTQLDCRQWARTARDAGMKAIIITAKHHDGFCLWPSAYSTHTVRESLWKGGKGDVLRELSEACKEYGLKLGVYLSPWDRNHPAYGTEAYNQVFANTLHEVLTGYGPIFEQWFDGANGEGPNGKRQEYNWELFRDVVQQCQPGALIFGGPCRQLRWVGNESGYAGQTNWSTFTQNATVDGAAGDVLGSGTENGAQWIPAEVDVSIRPGWFYSASTDERVKSVGKLLDIYYSSVGRNSNLLLNVPPDRRGLIHPNDSVRLMELRKALDETFAVNLAEKAKIKADNVRGKSSRYAPRRLTDGDYDTYWATDDGVASAQLEIDLGSQRRFNRLVLQEYIPLGQRVKSFRVEYWDGGAWQPLDRQTTIGYKRILCFPTLTARKLRVSIDESLACPVLSEIGVYEAPEMLAPLEITRTKEGMVSILCESKDPVIRYTLDGTEPTASSPVYAAPFALPGAGKVKAKAFIAANAQSGETQAVRFDLAPAKWTPAAPSGREIERAIDGNPASGCRLAPGATQIAVGLGEKILLKGFTYTPIRDYPGTIYRYNFYVSTDGKNWKKIKSGASFENIKNNPIPQDVSFDEPVRANYIKLESLETTTPGERPGVAELGVLTK